MEAKIYHEEIRVKTGNYGWIDIDSGMSYGYLGATFKINSIMQLRKKSNQFKMFQFESIEWFNEHDFGYWKDADIVWQSF